MFLGNTIDSIFLSRFFLYVLLAAVGLLIIFGLNYAFNSFKVRIDFDSASREVILVAFENFVRQGNFRCTILIWCPFYPRIDS